MRILSLLLLLTLAAAAQDVYVLNWLEADLDGDKVPERVLVVSADSPDPNAKARKELRVMKRKGGKMVTVHKMPLNDASFTSKMGMWQLEEPATKLWGLNYEAATKRVLVCFTPNSGEFFWLKWNGKAYVTESSGD